MYYKPGTLPDDVRPGDFILVRRPGVMMGKLIAYGQKKRLEPQDATWSHAALVLNEEGYIMEALEFGVEIEHIRKYSQHKVMHYPMSLNKKDTQQMMDFAYAVYDAKEHYGYLTIASVIFSLATGSRFVFGIAGTSICSGFVSEALCRAGYIFPKPPAYMTPGDLNKMFRELHP